MLKDGMTYSIVTFGTIGTDCAENSIILLCMGRCLVTSVCCDKILALSEYATVRIIRNYNISHGKNVSFWY
jgi:hypothetical protein